MYKFLKVGVIITTALVVIAEIIFTVLFSKILETNHQIFKEYTTPWYIQPFTYLSLVFLISFTIIICLILVTHLSEKINFENGEYIEFLKFKDARKSDV